VQFAAPDENGSCREITRLEREPSSTGPWKRPLGVPTVADRALQRSTAEVLPAIYAQDFLPCSFGGRPKLSAHHALATLKNTDLRP
jgi:retron-type reverse transcriptase